MSFGRTSLFLTVASILASLPPAAAQARQLGASPDQADRPSSATSSQEDQDADATQDIVVTATKRAQNLSDVPASISALDAGLLQQRGVTKLTDLNAAVPGLQFSPANTSVSIVLRGVGHQLYSPSAENSVALHLDGVYLSSPQSVQVAFFDVDRVEVLRGPQGSLYGRNATGGAINIISAMPTSTLQGFISGSVANYRRTDIEGAIGGPIAGEALQARVGGFWHRRRRGFGTNIPTGTPVDDLDEYGGKLSIVGRPSDALTITLRGDYYHAKDALGQYHALPPVRPPVPGAQPLPQLLGGTIAADVRDTNYNEPNSRHVRVGGVSGQIDWKLGDGFSIRSITAYRRSKSSFQNDLDGTQLPIFDPFRLFQTNRQISEELQLTYSSGPVYALLGGYLFHEKVDSSISINSYLRRGLPAFGIPPIFPAPFGVFDQQARSKTDAKALFANVEWDATSRLNLGFGLRYSEEKKFNRGFNVAFFPNFATYPGVGYDTVDASRKSKGVTPRFTARYELVDGLNAYATVSRGFKSGEFISGTSQYARPEFVWAYEAGLKGTAFDRRVRFSTAAFFYDYRDLQLQRVVTPITLLENAPKARLKGVEGEFTVVLPAGFSVDGNFTYLDSKLKGFVTENPNVPGNPVQDLTGNRFPMAPTFTYNLSLQKRLDLGAIGTGTARIDYQHTSSTYLDIFNSTANAYRPAFSLLGASYRQELNDHLSILFWGRNLTDKTVKYGEVANLIPNLIVRSGGVPVPVAYTAAATLNEPRTYGATVRYQW